MKEGRNEENEYAFKNVMDGLHTSKIFSVASFAVALCSVLCCCLPWFGLVTGILSVVFAVVSRKTIGYFDGLAVAGLIIGIFGIVFGVSNMILDYLINNTDYLNEFLAEYEKMLEQYMVEVGEKPNV